MAEYKGDLRLKMQRYSIILGMLETSPEVSDKSAISGLKGRVQALKS